MVELTDKLKAGKKAIKTAREKLAKDFNQMAIDYVKVLLTVKVPDPEKLAHGGAAPVDKPALTKMVKKRNRKDSE